MASVTAARNPGREHLREGISEVSVHGRSYDLASLLSSDPEYFLGSAHVTKYGAHPMLLVKFLDSAVRLHLQAHPSREFARTHLGSAVGKTEAYHVLGARDGEEAFIFAGFQRPPSLEELKRLIETQDIRGLEQCCDRIGIQPGETWFIPAGLPHAIGPGVFTVEIQEPSDLVVRLEFEKAGYTLPASARFMNRDIDFALSLMDISAHSRDEIYSTCRCEPKRLRELGPGSWVDELIGPSLTPCFQVRRTRLESRIKKEESAFHVAIVTAGQAEIKVGATQYRLNTYDKYCVPCELGPIEIKPVGGFVEIVESYPPL
jgi:mannose-6-phosphate isomerase